MKKITSSQKQFIKSEYKKLHTNCSTYFDSGELDKLRDARLKINIFINTIENIFDADMYTTILPSLK